MTATTPPNTTHDAEQDARTGSRPKEPDNNQGFSEEQANVNVEDTLPMDLDAHSTRASESSNNGDPETASLGKLEHSGTSGGVLGAEDSAHYPLASQGGMTEDVNTEGERPSDVPPQAGVVPTREQFTPGVDLPSEQSNMQIDPPTVAEGQLPGEPTAAPELQPPFPPSIAIESHKRDLDLLPRIPGLFRLLDLYLERGSNDNFEKVIIDHDSMGDAMNLLQDGSYKTINRIDFGALDAIPIKPVGVYGSKSAIVEFLMNAGAIDGSIAEILKRPLNQHGQLFPYLRSGIYLLVNAFPPDLQSSSKVIHVIYWPEDETWNDNASQNVQKNRVTFMRYLTKLASDIRLLVSEDHAAGFVWKYDDINEDDNEEDDSSLDGDSDSDDRFVKFEVTKTADEEEGVQMFDGFTFYHPALDFHDNSNTLVTLVPSETSQAFLATTTREAGVRAERINMNFSALGLKSLMKKYPTIYLGEKIDEASIHNLFDQGALPRAASAIYLEYLNLDMTASEVRDQQAAALSQLQSDWPEIRKNVEIMVRKRFAECYPSLELDSGIDPDFSPDIDLTSRLEAAPKARNVYDQYQKQSVPKTIESVEYERLRERFLDVQKTLEESETMTDENRRLLLEGIHSMDKSEVTPPNKNTKPGRVSRLVSAAMSWMLPTEPPDTSRRKFSRASFGRNDAEFLTNIDHFGAFPDYTPAIQTIQTVAKKWIEGRISETTEHLARTLFKNIEVSLLERIAYKYKLKKFSQCRADLCKALSPEHSPSSALSLEYLQRSATHSPEPKFAVEAVVYSRGQPSVEYSMVQLEFRPEDKRALDVDPSHLSPIPTNRLPVLRSTPTSYRLLYIRLLDQGHRLLQVFESPRGIDIFLDDSRDVAFRNLQKHFASREDRSLFFDVDEETRLLAIAYVEKGRTFIQTFVMDDRFAILQPRGAPHELTLGYTEGPPAIREICFFSGSEDICLVEESGTIRIFSLQTQAFCPGIVHLSSKPVLVKSSPDGSALVLVERTQETDGWQVRVFHQATFGENPNGFLLRLPQSFNDATQFTVSSLGRRSCVYLVAHSPATSALLSVALRISRMEAEYLFQQKPGRITRPQSVNTVNNSLLDCFSDVWDRFPVIPAIPREFAVSRPPMQLTVVEYTEQSALQRIPRYFIDTIRDFTRRSPKPVGRCLDSISVAVKLAPEDRTLDSQMEPCLAGEWFVEVICLIPVHIAIARENRFVPLKDGRCQEDLNSKLLGSEVPEIIDAITLGPYEAILGSYMSTKPIRVVSSMGEQSVGKSFSLNHLVDTSFAGSAMRTTEGVWLSLCPTKDQLVIALDFEGVHSLERTAQEDMLLVLFNAAISNLVMFRNNFVFNRNVASMFTSFQASTRLFDPQNNPNLFKGLLAIIIKDVRDSDKKEIVEEFRSKFNRIVLRERGDNFITVLHDSQLAVMPWDVIQSKEFYTRFSKLSKELFKQPDTHGNAGKFLLTLKTLMAKLTAQDWGSIDQTLIRHRTSAIQASLRQAMISGQGGVGPFGESEGLKNYDTQEDILGSDPGEIFCLATSDDARHEGLIRLLAPFGQEPARARAEDLCRYLQRIGEQRIEHVRKWIDLNVARFMPTDNPDIKALQREFDEFSRTLIANLQICLVKCDRCRLPCLRPKAHSAGSHNCGTTHRCTEICDFCLPIARLHEPDGSGRKNLCGLPAGHDGCHICKETAHVCAEPCQLTDKPGCQKTCTKPIGHSDDTHICAANLHQCGQSCKLQDLVLHDGESFSCSNTCVLPFDQPHESHTCSEMRSCPVRCELCRRYCTSGDHFHGLEPDAVHLCDQDHPCRETCQSLGTCMVEPKPESIEMVYRGLHDTFSYTRFTQVAKKLSCGVPIPRGQRKHDGQHVHTTEESLFHFCEASCSHCGYICHLQYGHAQREHETAHGSMQHTVWAVEGPEGSTLEVEGHRFGAQDGGAPQLCSMNCKHLGRHAHLAFCRNSSEFGHEAETEHVRERIQPQPDLPKDWVSHRLFWARTGFKDPYSRGDQAEFALCDSLCSGREHEASGDQPAKPSYCVLPIFHPPELQWEEMEPGKHVSNDGHLFHCPDPSTITPSFHVIFVLDGSTSMRNKDRLPLEHQPVAARIVSRHNNRFGAVLSALYQFLQERDSSNGEDERRDAYSILVFNQLTEIIVQNDMSSSIDQLMDNAISASPSWGTNFPDALQTAQRVMEESWSTERAPVVVFLSDGEGYLDEDIMRGLCDRAVALGSPLSFWSISFGPYSRVLREMADIAKDVASRAPRGSNATAVPSDFRTAINTVQLAKAFSNIATSLRKARASLINPTTPALSHSQAPKDMLLI